MLSCVINSRRSVNNGCIFCSKALHKIKPNLKMTRLSYHTVKHFRTLYAVNEAAWCWNQENIAFISILLIHTAQAACAIFGYFANWLVYKYLYIILCWSRQQETPPPQNKPVVPQTQELSIGGSRSWANSKQTQSDGKFVLLLLSQCFILSTGCKRAKKFQGYAHS